MKLHELSLAGAFLIELERREDERGFFARTFCKNELANYGLETEIVQCNVSFNKRRGTVRGMHFQKRPHEEAKIVRCTQGACYDVIVDIRPTSSTFCHWVGIELTAQNHKALYVPKGFAHGFQTLTDNTEVFYQMSEQYYPELASGVRWNDPALGIQWVIHDNITIAERDAAFPDIQILAANL